MTTTKAKILLSFQIHPDPSPKLISLQVTAGIDFQRVNLILVVEERSRARRELPSGKIGARENTLFCSKKLRRDSGQKHCFPFISVLFYPNLQLATKLLRHPSRLPIIQS